MRTTQRILVVDADNSRQAALRPLFEAAGHEVAEASNLKQASAALKTVAPSLIVLERELPSGDGLALLEALPRGEDDFIPVIVTGDGTSAGRRLEALGRGADDVLHRPCDPAEFLAKARALLRVKAIHDRTRATQRRLENLVVSDPLTGLYNRRYLKDRLLQEVSRSGRSNAELAVGLVDLDGFKQINDLHGHLVGDEVLRLVGDALHRCLRASDVAIRFGGDEFALLLPEASAAGALQVGERILEVLGTLTPAGARQLRGQVSASVGIVHCKGPFGGAPEDLLRGADQALYEAKNAGKHCVCVREQRRARA